MFNSIQFHSPFPLGLSAPILCCFSSKVSIKNEVISERGRGLYSTLRFNMSVNPGQRPLSSRSQRTLNSQNKPNVFDDLAVGSIIGYTIIMAQALGPRPWAPGPGPQAPGPEKLLNPPTFHFARAQVSFTRIASRSIN